MRRFNKFFVRCVSEAMLTELKWYVKVARYTGASPFYFGLIDYKYEGIGNAMARAKSKKSPDASGTLQKRSYKVAWSNCKLTELDAPVILEAAEDLPSLCDVLASHFATGGEFSVRFNPDKQTFSAFVICSPDVDTGVATGISAFAGNVPQAIAAVLYKLDLYHAGSDRITTSGQSMGFG